MLATVAGVVASVVLVAVSTSVVSTVCSIVAFESKCEVRSSVVCSETVVSNCAVVIVNFLVGASVCAVISAGFIVGRREVFSSTLFWVVDEVSVVNSLWLSVV